MADEPRMGWMGEAEGVAEAAIAPEEFLRRLREETPVPASEGGPWLSLAPFTASINGDTFTIWNMAGKGGHTRLDGVVAATQGGCLVRYFIRPPAGMLTLLIAATIFAMLIPVILSLLVLGPSGLFFYVFIVPVMGLNWLLLPWFQRIKSRNTLAFLRDLLRRHRDDSSHDRQ